MTQNTPSPDNTNFPILTFHRMTITISIIVAIFCLFFALIVLPFAIVHEDANNPKVKTVQQKIEEAINKKGYTYIGYHCDDMNHDWLSRGGFIKAKNPDGEEKIIFWRYGDNGGLFDNDFIFEETPDLKPIC